MRTSEELKHNLLIPLNTDTILTTTTRLINYQHYNIWRVEAPVALRTSLSPPLGGEAGQPTAGPTPNPGKPSSLKTILQIKRKRKKKVPLVLPENHPPCEPSPQVKINTYVKEI